MPEAVGEVKLFWQDNAEFTNRVHVMEDLKESLKWDLCFRALRHHQIVHICEILREVSDFSVESVLLFHLLRGLKGNRHRVRLLLGCV